MTDPPADIGPDPDPDLDAGTALDDRLGLASALHDGEASAEECALADDSAVMAARARFEAVARWLADVPPPPDGLLEAHVATALAAVEDEREEGSARPVGRLAGRRPWWQRAPLGAVAAAIAVVALVGAIGLAAGGGDTDEDTATAELDASEAGGDDGAAGSAGTAETALPGIEQETFVTYQELASALAGRLDDGPGTSGDATADAAPMTEDEAAPPAEAGPPAPAPTTVGGCDPIAAAGLDPATVQLASSVVVAGRPIVALVHDAAGEPTLTSVDEASCTVADRRPLPRS